MEIDLGHKIGISQNWREHFTYFSYIFFSQRHWSSFHATRSTQKKWNEIIRMYMEGIDKYVPKMIITEKKSMDSLIEDVN